MDTVAGYAERFGVYDRMGRFLANSLGAEETTLYKMVAAYAMFANGGARVEPTLVDRVQDRCGKHHLPPRPAPVRGLQLADDLDPGQSPEIRRQPRAGDGPDHRLPAHLDAARAWSQRGTGARHRNLPVPARAARPAPRTTPRTSGSSAITSNIVAGCYIGYDQPRTLGDAPSAARSAGRSSRASWRRR